MAFYQLPKIISKDKKPPFGARINWHHPLSQGLVGAWLFNEDGGLKLYNLSKSDPIYLQDYNNNGFTWLGEDISISSAVPQFLYTLHIPIAGDMSVCSIIYTSTVNSGLMHYGDTIINPGAWDRAINIDASGYITCKWWTSGHDNDWLTSNSIVTDGTRKHIVVTNKSTAPGKRIYIDGKLDADDNKAYGYTGYNSYSPGYLHIARGHSDIGDRLFNGKMNLFYMWSRTLSEEEVASLYANPYQMFLPVVWDAYYVSEAPPPPTVGKSIFGYDSIFHAGGIIQT